ncbi:SURF1 family protein [Sphingomonas bacterium]|uniref:SURF1 family protein n=1 Tax=Sphingomonas bacterium TaxID=1895847 RepID=UPI0020C683AD|nr:SURF1 family protein [Sphingomonas bacterium]
MTPPTGARPPRSWRALVAIGVLGLAAMLAFAALGAWQVERRAWKLGLIARTGERLAAAPVPAPGPGEWARVTRTRDEYRRVSLRGHYIGAARTLVAASTEYGPGYWAMTPLRDDRGYMVLVNRGFVPSAAQRVAPPGEVRVVGLLRITEPGGDLLRSNAPAAGRWYSRDVAAIAAARHLSPVAPFFVDADATPNPGGYPIGGLTVVSFTNNHLVYAITWLTLMTMTAVATTIGLRHEWRAWARR